LRIVGDGPEFKALRRIAGSNVEFCGRVGDKELRELYARCLALVMPGEEDFGIVAVEALASGKPVVALGRGGVTEIVPTEDPVGGVLYRENSDATLLKAIHEMESVYHSISPQALQSWALQFSEAEFARKMDALLFGSGVPARWEGADAAADRHRHLVSALAEEPQNRDGPM
jgi:glycosyltransferase involved in cell wall biosynthesis